MPTLFRANTLSSQHSLFSAQELVVEAVPTSTALVYRASRKTHEDPPQKNQFLRGTVPESRELLSWGLLGPARIPFASDAAVGFRYLGTASTCAYGRVPTSVGHTTFRKDLGPRPLSIHRGQRLAGQSSSRRRLGKLSVEDTDTCMRTR